MSKKSEKDPDQKQDQKEEQELDIKVEGPSSEQEDSADAEKDKHDSQEKASEGKDSEATLKAQIAEMNDKYLRLYSDFDNYRKRVNKEKLEMVKTASSDVVLALLPVIDDMERAIKAFQDTEAALGEKAAEDEMEKDLKVKGDQKNALFEGVNLIYNKMINVLKQKGVTECEVMGKTFDPELAEAIAQIPAPDERLTVHTFLVLCFHKTNVFISNIRQKSLCQQPDQKILTNISCLFCSAVKS